MKIYFFILLTFLSFNAFSQLPTIKAIGGKGTNVNWESIKVEENSEENGPGFFYNDCAQGTTPIKASSTHITEGKYNFGINNLSDSDPMTAWIEGKKGYGIGEFFEVKAYGINAIYNGYQFSPSVWKDNSRVKKFKVYKNNKPICYLMLTDEMGVQYFELPNSIEKGGTLKEYTFKFEIVEVYKGLKWDDVAISHIDYVLCCFAENTIIQSDSIQAPISSISNGYTISTIDINTGVKSETEVEKTTKQTHLSLLKIVTKSCKIDLTPDHPLYIKGYGFKSMKELLLINKKSNYLDLINEIEILIWNNNTNKLEYEKLLSIELIQGTFNTYSILKLSKGDTFIANGFVTTTYGITPN